MALIFASGGSSAGETITKDLISSIIKKSAGVINHPIVLPDTQVSVDQSIKDFKRERVLFNDVPFIPDRMNVQRGNCFILTLKLCIDRLCNNNSRNRLCNSSDIIDTIMQRACRTSAGIDSYFKVQELFCVPGTFLSHRTGEDPPTIVDVFIDSNDNLIARLEVRNSFALYDNSTMDEMSGEENMEPPPWLIIDTVVIDESNFTLSTHSRNLMITINNNTAPSNNSSNHRHSGQTSSLL